MRRNEKLISEIAEINDILSKGDVIRIAMVDKSRPYIVPMNYGFKDGVIFLHCAQEGRKVDILKENPNVCFEISVDTALFRKEQSCGWTYHFRSVIGSGQVLFVEEKNEKLIGLSAIMEQYGSSEHSFSEKAVDNTLILRIDIEEISGKKSQPVKNI